MGATSGFKVGIASPVTIDIGLVTAGSVNSWLAGNFNYDISSAYPDVAQGQLSADDATNLAKLSVTQDTAGFFNLPVCKVLDLRSFPNAAAGTGYANSMFGFPVILFSSCQEYPPKPSRPFLPSFLPSSLPDTLSLNIPKTPSTHTHQKKERKKNPLTPPSHPLALCGCASTSALGGASDGNNLKFYNSVSSKIQRYVLPAPVRFQNGNCPGDLNPGLDETPP